MAKFQFPDHPGVGRQNPFAGESGVNPFGDVESSAPSDTVEPNNPYQSGEAESSALQPYRPDDYESFLPSRGPWVFGLGLTGFIVQLLAIMVSLGIMASGADYLPALAYGLPGQLLGLAVSVPAWIMGQSDRQAMSRGAMETSGQQATRSGLRLAIIGTLLGSGQMLWFVGLLIAAEFVG